MRPLMLHGHERAITQIKYNREGDLLFTTGKDRSPNVWFSINGERLGTYEGHKGAVWCIDVDYRSEKLLSGSADNTCKIWDVETGKLLINHETLSAVRTCGFSYSGNLVFITTDQALQQPCALHLFDIRAPETLRSNNPRWSQKISPSKITSALWGHLDESIITGHEDGTINQWDINSESVTASAKEHSRGITDIQMDLNSFAFISASMDNSAKLFDARDLVLMKTYKTDRPVNSAAISSIKPHVMLGGGQEAMDVTTTSTRVGNFESRFFHLVFEEEFARVKGHFGPINSVAFHPDGKGFSSGGEDGYVRVHNFDNDYFELELEY